MIILNKKELSKTARCSLYSLTLFTYSIQSFYSLTILQEVLEDFEGIGINECLFCCHWSQSLEKNLKHMTKVHSFFIPDTEFCTDIAGFITYLGMSFLLQPMGGGGGGGLNLIFFKSL